MTTSSNTPLSPNSLESMVDTSAVFPPFASSQLPYFHNHSPIIENNHLAVPTQIRASNTTTPTLDSIENGSNKAFLAPVVVLQDPNSLYKIGAEYFESKQWDKGFLYLQEKLRGNLNTAATVLETLNSIFEKNNTFEQNHILLRTRGYAYYLIQSTTGNLQKALLDFKNALIIHPSYHHDPILLRNLAISYCRLHQWDAGLTCFSKLLMLKPNTTLIAEYVLTKLNNFSKYFPKLERNPLFLCTRDHAHSILKEAKAAINDYAAAETIFPALANNSFFLKRQDDAYNRQNEIAKVLVKYAKAVECNEALIKSDVFRKNWINAYNAFIAQERAKTKNKNETIVADRTISPYSGPVI